MVLVGWAYRFDGICTGPLSDRKSSGHSAIFVFRPKCAKWKNPSERARLKVAESACRSHKRRLDERWAGVGGRRAERLNAQAHVAGDHRTARRALHGAGPLFVHGDSDHDLVLRSIAGSIIVPTSAVVNPRAGHRRGARAKPPIGLLAPFRAVDALQQGVPCGGRCRQADGGLPGWRGFTDEFFRASLSAGADRHAKKPAGRGIGGLTRACPYGTGGRSAGLAADARGAARARWCHTKSTSRGRGSWATYAVLLINLRVGWRRRSGTWSAFPTRSS